MSNVSVDDEGDSDADAVRNVRAQEAFIQDKFAKSRVKYLRNPDGSFSEASPLRIAG